LALGAAAASDRLCLEAIFAAVDDDTIIAAEPGSSARIASCLTVICCCPSASVLIQPFGQEGYCPRGLVSKL
jgi:hypothetical protein